MTDEGPGASIKSCCAGFYELPIVSMILGNTLHPGGPALTRKLAAAAIVGRDTDVLDVASGRGESARVLAAHFGCRVTGVDYSRTNAERAKELTRDAGLSPRVSFAAGDAESLPFKDDSFDVVISECSLCTFPDLERSLTEIRRVLRPNGRIGISDVVLNGPVPEALQDVLGHVLCIAGAHPSDGYERALNDAGFNAIRTHDVSFVLEEMIGQIERRVDTLEGTLDPDQLREFPDLRDAAPKLTAAREAVRSGGIGYAMFTARNPRLVEIAR